jgi:transcriptional regulator with XRE-family HTH domain
MRAYSQDVAERVREVMGWESVKTAPLARAARIPRSTLIRRLSGQGAPFTIDELERLAHVLGVSVSELFPRTA